MDNDTAAVFRSKVDEQPALIKQEEMMKKKTQMELLQIIDNKNETLPRKWAEYRRREQSVFTQHMGIQHAHTNSHTDMNVFIEYVSVITAWQKLHLYTTNAQ